MSRKKWRRAADEKPKEPGKYFVRMFIHEVPTVAYYNTLPLDTWHIKIGGMSWQIADVYEWSKIPRRRTRQ